MKNMIFCNLFYSGASAIVPILEEYLRTTNINVLNYGPEATELLVESPPQPPFFHWTHTSPEFFIPMFERDDIRVVFLHRDPRDVAISYLEDHIHRGVVARGRLKEVLQGLSHGNFANFVRDACKWVGLSDKYPIKVIRFDELKRDTVGVTLDVLEFYGLPATQERKEAIHQLYTLKHSFEAMAKRPRGSEGEMVRTRYIVRKGVSGEWRELFSQKALENWDEQLGQEIHFLGYEHCI